MSEISTVEHIKETPEEAASSAPVLMDERPAAIPRLFSAVSRANIIIRGRRRSPRDVYHWLLTTTWPQFAGLGLSAYLLANAMFAGLYLLDRHGVLNARPGNFIDAFFFSVETIGTIGYGAMSPADTYSNIIMTAENFFGLSFVAVATGVIFARVSRPTARVMFSKNAIITTHDGKPTLMFRAANERANQVLEAEVTVSITRQRKTAEGSTMRRFEDLKLERAKTPLFALSWSILHVIDETSPLYGSTAASMGRRGAADHHRLVRHGRELRPTYPCPPRLPARRHPVEPPVQGRNYLRRRRKAGVGLWPLPRR